MYKRCSYDFIVDNCNLRIKIYVQVLCFQFIIWWFFEFRNWIALILIKEKKEEEELVNVIIKMAYDHGASGPHGRGLNVIEGMISLFTADDEFLMISYIGHL